MMLILLQLIIFSVNTLQAHMPEPVDLVNSRNKASHSGYGYYGRDDYEAFVKLQKSCTQQNREQEFQIFSRNCSGKKKRPVTLDREQFKDLATQLIKGQFVTQILNNALDEIKLIDPAFNPPAGCMSEPVNPKKATHRTLRSNSMSLNNAVSAALLAQMHQLPKDGSKPKNNYRKRLEINYPFLFKPSERYSELINLMKNEMGNAVDTDVDNIAAHYDTTAAFEAHISLNPTFENSMNTLLNNIKTGYANHLKENILKLCSSNDGLFNSKRDSLSSLKFLKDNFLRDFQQNLVDLSPNDRILANEYLCAQSFYYKAEEFDSDCDGVPDNNDVEPNDPFIPTSNFTFENPNHSLNPPFISYAKYEAKLEENTIKVTRALKVRYAPSLTETEKNALAAKTRQCIDKLATDMKTSFEALKKSPAGSSYSNRRLELDFQMQLVAESEADFEVHKCFCSTCSIKYIPPGSSTPTRIPRNTCESDFTPEMIASRSNPSINPTENSRDWSMQDDSANLTIQSLNEGDCATVKHELMHKLGLPDEYHNENYYPFNQIAPYSSIMNGGHEILDRHLKFILSPKACEKGSENYGY